MDEPLTPNCPLCGSPPMMVMADGEQAFCGNDRCVLLIWDSTKSLDDNLMDAGVVRWEPTEGDGSDE